MLDEKTAEEYGKAVLGMADREILRRVFVFGSVAKYGQGRDLDIVFEVTAEFFVAYSHNCVSAMAGFHPVEKVLMPMASMYWNYFSPVQARTEYAMITVGIHGEDLMNLSKIVGVENVDVICLPEGWQDDSSIISKILQQEFNLSQDPKILQNIRESCIEIK